MTRSNITVFAFATAILLADCGKKEEAPVPAPAPPVPPVVQVAPTTKMDPPLFIEAVAKLEGSTETPVNAQVSGYLVQQAYEEGSVVKKGDLLFLVNTKPFQPDLKAQTNSAQASGTAAKIIAPVDGIAGRALPGLGDLIKPGMPLTTIATPDPMEAVFTLPEKIYRDNAERIVRASFELTQADGTPYPLKGKFAQIESQAPASTGPITIHALFPNADLLLRPGQYAKVRVANP